MSTQILFVRCPYCDGTFSARQLSRHRCGESGHRVTKHDWFEAVDKARVKAGLPEQIYGYEVEYRRHDGATRKFKCAVNSEAAARRKAIFKTLFTEVVAVQAFTYSQYCRAFGIPGSKM